MSYASAVWDQNWEVVRLTILLKHALSLAVAILDIPVCISVLPFF